MLRPLRKFFTDPSIRKFWHSGPIDRNLLWANLDMEESHHDPDNPDHVTQKNLKQMCMGFDTMTMARLWKPAEYAKRAFEPRQNRQAHIPCMKRLNVNDT